MMPELSTPAGRLHFRRATDDDRALLQRVYASVRADELARVPEWSDAQRAAFVEQQFNAQHIAYRHRYPAADWLLILLDDAPAGRLYLDRTPERIHIIDIALLPEFRGRGIGTRILGHLFDEGAASGGIPVRIYVERFNPALELYRRLGFEMVDDSNPVYWLMERRASKD
jgi:ribosomal protein S18 acetylase RimI-like enzyme